MAYDVASSINDLLFKNQSVIIPGFGGFVLNEQSANIDYIKSTITPPSKIPSFNKNLTLNDGILVDHIKNKNRCTLEQANQIVKDFVVAAEKKIEAKEIIEFPKVGRLYRDYSKSLQFLPYDTNFDTNAFGLPVIEVHPFSRNINSTSPSVNTKTEPVTTSTATRQPIVNSSPKNNPVLEAPFANNSRLNDDETVANIPLNETKPKGIFKWAQMTLPLLLIASIFVIGLSFFMMQRGSDTKTVKANSTASLTVAGEDKKINTSPSIDEAEITPITDTDESEISYDSEIDEPLTDPSTEEDSDRSTSSSYTEDIPSSRECIVIVGQFSAKENADRFVQQIENDGYDSYMGWNSEKEWNTVGVKFSYKTESEKNRMHRKLKYEFDNAAWILRD